MSAAAAVTMAPAGAPTASPAASPEAAGGRRRMLLVAAPLALVAAGAGLWFGGLLQPLLGLGAAQRKPAPTAAETAAAPKPPVFVDVPELVANLNAGARKSAFVKVRAKIELARMEDQPALQAAMPRLLDLFQTYLREMRPEELRGSAGTYRLREELIARANIACAPLRIVDILFVELLTQ